MEQPITDKRLHALRSWMQAHNAQAFIVPTADPHGSEYIADRWKTREWLTGFTGSAGIAVVTPDDALLWTDSRYWLQAAAQLDGTAFGLMRDGDNSVPDYVEWLSAWARHHTGAAIAFTADTMPEIERQRLTAAMPTHATVQPVGDDPFDTLWADRPAVPANAIVEQPLARTGESSPTKAERVRAALQGGPLGEALLLSDLADIAWLLNLRGTDIAFNPVFYAYLALDLRTGGGILFTDTRRVPESVRQSLLAQGIGIDDYNRWPTCFDTISARSWLLTDEMNCAVVQAAQECTTCHLIPSPVALLRAVKNPTEQEGFRRAMERDGVAMVKLLRWLDERHGDATELSVAEHLHRLRAEQADFRGLSFETIAASGPHGAIVHYEPSAETDQPLGRQGFLLLDSGAQYADGTTDITRTIPLGELTDEERRVYTLVLKGHIELSALRFPTGTYGLELDLAARRAMWREGYDFGHGTGHGVGSYLCVHEGPQQIRKNLRPCTQVPFVPGMTITDEPGIYLPGRFGVRIENVLLVIGDGETPFGHFCRFEPLTLCPIDLRPVVRDMLTADERAWLNSYHAEVRRRLMPLLTDEAERRWLHQATKEID